MKQLFLSSLVVILLLWNSAERRSPLLAEPAAVTIRVRDAAGGGVAGVRISARLEKHAHPDFENPVIAARAESAPDGTVRLTGLHTDRTYTLVVTAPDARWKEFHDQCIEDWAPKDREIRLAAPRPIQGVVRSSGGKPIPFARVLVTVGRWRSATIADKQGAFAFPHAPPGAAALIAEVDRKGATPARGPTSSITLEDTRVDPVLPVIPGDRQPLLIVRVSTPGGRPPMRGVALFKGRRSERGFSSTVASASMLEGGAACSTEFSTPMTVDVALARSEFGEPLACGPGKAGPFGPGPREESFQLPEELTIEGRVLGPDKQPLAGVLVRARLQQSASGFGTWLEASHGEGVSGPDGRYRIGGLGKHDYVLLCVSNNKHVGGRAKSIGGKDGVDLTMRLAVAPTLTFTAESGAAVAGALVRIKEDEHRSFDQSEEHSRQREAKTDAEGRVQFQGLDPEQKYLLTAYPPTGRSELLPWEIKGWKPVDTSLVFEAARRLAGIVRDQHKRPIAKARVSWKPTGSSSGRKRASGQPRKAGRTVAGDDGTFAVGKLRPGRYEVVARRPEIRRTGTGPAPPEPKDVCKAVVVEADADDISLCVRMPDKLTLRVWGWDKSLGKPTVLIAAIGDEGDGPVSMTRRLGKDGTLVVKGLDWRVRYALWMPSLKDGKYIYAPSLRPKDEPVTATAKDGATVTGKIVSPKGTKARKVWAVYPGFQVPGRVKSGGRFEIVGLPPGPWTLRACGKLGKALLETEGACEPDQEPVLTLTAD